MYVHRINKGFVHIPSFITLTLANDEIQDAYMIFFKLRE